MTSPHDGLEFVFGNTHNQVIAHDAATHPAIRHKGQTAKHLAFRNVRPPLERVPNARSELFVVGHERSRLHGFGLVPLFTGSEEGPRLSKQAAGQARLAEMIRLVERDAGKQRPEGLIRIARRAKRRRA